MIFSKYSPSRYYIHIHNIQVSSFPILFKYIKENLKIPHKCVKYNLFLEWIIKRLLSIQCLSNAFFLSYKTILKKITKQGQRFRTQTNNNNNNKQK